MTENVKLFPVATAVLKKLQFFGGCGYYFRDVKKPVLKSTGDI